MGASTSMLNGADTPASGAAYAEQRPPGCRLPRRAELLIVLSGNPCVRPATRSLEFPGSEDAIAHARFGGQVCTCLGSFRVCVCGTIINRASVTHEARGR